jgi:hypothetical protein
MFITILLLFYFIIGVQIAFKPNKTMQLQFLIAILGSLYCFNYHSHMVNL